MTFLRKHWRWLLVLAALGAGFALGVSCRAEPEVRIRDKLVTVEVKKVVEVVREVKVREAAEVKLVWREKVTTPDGTVRETEHSATDTRARESSSVAAERATSREASVVSEREEVRTPGLPAWRVGALAGIQVQQVSLLPPGVGPVAFGAIVERRVLGPLSVGAWGLSSGAAGLAFTVEF